nr:hypothetical protein [uncultured Anaerostipes sp.]
MIVTIMGKAYRMSRKESKKFLDQMKNNVPFGIYAVEKDGIIEMRNDQCKSRTKLKELKRTFKQQGYKVYSNTGD